MSIVNPVTSDNSVCILVATSPFPPLWSSELRTPTHVVAQQFENIPQQLLGNNEKLSKFFFFFFFLSAFGSFTSSTKRDTSFQ